MTTPGTEAEPYHPLLDIAGGQYFPEPYSVPQLPRSLRVGLIPVASFATLSVASTSCLIAFIMSRISWKCRDRKWVGHNQYVCLVLNLLLADLQQSLAFMISWHWIRTEQILAPHPACFAQGWLLQSGDVGSGFFVLAIAIHTCYTAIYGKLLSGRMFACSVVGIWFAVYFLTIMGVAMHGPRRYFTAAGAWCWVSSAYEVDRLWYHYIWIFVIQFGTVLIYLSTYITLRRKASQLLVNGEVPTNGPNADTIKSIKRITNLMTLYPFVYILLTLPLSASRMWTMSNSGKPTSNLFFCLAGSLLTSCGWVDTLLYTLTRKRLLRDTMRDTLLPPPPRTETMTTAERTYGKGIVHTRSLTVESDQVGASSRRASRALQGRVSDRRIGSARRRGSVGSNEPSELEHMTAGHKAVGRRFSSDTDWNMCSWSA